jgi:ketosteroid isomerase-like protein
MSSDDNIKTIQLVYEAFGRGDVATILDSVTEDVDWASEAASTDAPWYGVRRGRDGVASFFTAFGTTMEVLDFTPVTFAGAGDDVLTVVRFASKSIKTGRESRMDLHHWFRFRDGKIAFYRGTEDTAQTVAALRG